MSKIAKPYVITIVGPESSGKTTLARELSLFLKCPWVPEYARTYLSGLDRPYEAEDLNAIAQGQLEAISSFPEEEMSFSTSDFLNRLYGIIGNRVVDGVQGKSFLSFPASDFGPDPRKVLIVDNGVLSVKLWARIKYGTVPQAVTEAMEQDITDMYILCRPVFPWAEDPLREAPRLIDRVWIYNHFLRELITMRK